MSSPQTPTGPPTANAIVYLMKDLEKAADAFEPNNNLVRVLLDVGRELNAAETHESAAVIITRAADEVFGWDCCTIDLYSEDQKRIFNVITADVVDGRRTFFPRSR